MRFDGWPSWPPAERFQAPGIARQALLVLSVLFAAIPLRSALAQELHAEMRIVAAPLAPPQTLAPPPPMVLPAPAPVAAASSGNPTVFKSETDAFTTGMRSYSAGDKSAAIRALEYAAVKGHPRALWKLGRMYAEGDGVDHDDLKAFEYFSKVADDNADVQPGTPNSGFVSSAFVSLGGYFLHGIPGTYVKSNPRRAIELFQYAASYFGDAGAQYSLGRLQLDGEVVAKDPRRAAQWLNLAAEKGHTAAQALLGQMLVNGTGVPRQRALGLMWINLAHDHADPAKDAWIFELHDQVMAQVSDLDLQAAQVFMDRYAKEKAADAGRR